MFFKKSTFIWNTSTHRFSEKTLSNSDLEPTDNYLAKTNNSEDPLWSRGKGSRFSCKQAAVQILPWTHHSWRKLWIVNHVQWSFWEDKNRWVSCADDIKLQSLRSVRFWTSLVRNCLKHPALSNRTLGFGTLTIDLASSRSLSWH